MTVGMSYTSVAVVGTGVTTTGQEQLNRCSEWGHAGGGGHRSPSRSDLGDIRRGGQEVTSWLIQRNEESGSKRGETRVPGEGVAK